MLSIIVSTLFISLIINVILKKFNLPTIIGYIITGTIIAYLFGLHEAVNNHQLKEIAEFGIVFLMFTIGLEFSIEHLRKMRYEVFVSGSLQIVVTSIIVFVICFYILHLDQVSSFIISLAIALSSTAIVLKTFNETGEINKRYGQRSLGILIMQDIAVIPILLIIGFLAKSSTNIPLILLEMIIGGFALLFFLWIFAKYLLEPFFTQIIKTNSDELFIGTILFLAISASYLAYILGFSYSLGAFIAGMLVAETKYKHQAEADLIPFRDILLGIFFITVGMQIDFQIIFAYVHIITLLLVTTIALKFFIIFFIVNHKDDKRTSIKTALSLVQIGEFSLAILELARTNDLLGSLYTQVLIVTITLSMILTPLILKNLTIITDKFIKQSLDINDEIDANDLNNHTIILGFGGFGENIAKHLKINQQEYVAVENNIDTFHKAFKKGEPVIFGNASKKSILKKLNIKESKSVIVAINNPKKLYNTCENILKVIPKEKIIVKVHTIKEKNMIEDLGIYHIYVEDEILSENICEFVSNKTT